MAWKVRGHCCTRWRPWPVSRSSYELSSDTRSSSARHHRRNMSSMISLTRQGGEADTAQQQASTAVHMMS